MRESPTRSQAGSTQPFWNGLLASQREMEPFCKQRSIAHLPDAAETATGASCAPGAERKALDAPSSPVSATLTAAARGARSMGVAVGTREPFALPAAVHRTLEFLFPGQTRTQHCHPT